MERVIKPVQLPPVIDRFCHLSVDAQKVMSAIYKQFEQEKENILISQVDRQSSQGPSRYYQSMYRSRFGCYPRTVQNTQGMNIRSQNNPEYNRRNINTSDTVTSHSKERQGPLPLNSNSSQITYKQRSIGNSDINIPSHEFPVEQISSLDSCDEQGAAYPGTQKSSQELLQRAVYPGIERSSQESLQRAVYPGIERSSQESFQRAAYPGIERSSQESFQRAAYPGIERSSQESLQRAAYPGIERSSQESLQRAAYPGIERSSQESLQRAVYPGIERSSQESFQRAAYPGIERSSQESFQRAAYPGIERSSQESLQRAAYPGIERSSQESLQRAAYPGIERSSQESLPLSLSPSLFPSLENITKATNIDVPTKGENITDYTDSNVESRIEEHNLHFTSKNRTKDNLIETISEKKMNIFQNGKEIPVAPDNCSYLREKQPYEKENNVGVSPPTTNINKVINTCFIPPITEMNISDDDVRHQRRNVMYTDAIDKKMADVARKKKLHSDLSDQRLPENNMCSITKRLLEHKQIRKDLEEKENKPVAVKGTEKTNKRKISSFFAPYKKLKVLEEKEDSHILPVVTDSSIDISTMDTEERRLNLLQKVNSSKEILIAIVYTDLRNQLRDNSNKKKTQNMKSKTPDKIMSIKISLIDKEPSLKTRDKLTDIYSIPSDIKDKFVCDWIRSFWNTVFSCTARKICYGAKELFITLFQYVYLDTKVGIEDWTVLDPQIAGWLLDPDNPPSSFVDCLKSVNLYQEQKEMIDFCTLLTEDFTLLGTLMNRLYQKLQARELWDLFCCVETKLVPLLAFMECQKVQIDTDKLLMFSEVLKSKIQKLEQKAHDSVGHSFLINSPAQLRQVLFEELRLDTKLPQKMKLAKTSVGHQISTSESVLQQLVDIHPLPRLILEYRQFQKLKSTYMDGIMSCVQTGHLSTHWDQISAATGRLSSYQPNVQAIPKAPIVVSNYKDNFIVDKENNDTLEIFARDIFRSKSGWSFLAADFQQIELRLLSHLADDDILLQMFKNQGDSDIFVELTSQWLGKAVIDVTSSEREQTKRIVYSVMYGAGKEKLAEYLKISPDNAKAIMNSFLVRFPAVNQFSKKCVDFCLKHGYTSTIFKRKRMIPNIKHKSPPLRAQAERQAVNFCLQGSAADLCKAAMLQIEQSLRNHKHLRARQLFQIHDELLLEVHDDDISAVNNLVKSVMEDCKGLCGSVVVLKIPIKVSISIGKTWGHMTPVK